MTWDFKSLRFFRCKSPNSASRLTYSVSELRLVGTGGGGGRLLAVLLRHKFLTIFGSEKSMNWWPMTKSEAGPTVCGLLWGCWGSCDQRKKSSEPRKLSPSSVAWPESPERNVEPLLLLFPLLREPVSPSLQSFGGDLGMWPQTWKDVF